MSIYVILAVPGHQSGEELECHILINVTLQKGHFRPKITTGGK
jgi:hypothetical protein